MDISRTVYPFQLMDIWSDSLWGCDKDAVSIHIQAFVQIDVLWFLYGLQLTS